MLRRKRTTSNEFSSVEEAVSVEQLPQVEEQSSEEVVVIQAPKARKNSFSSLLK